MQIQDRSLFGLLFFILLQAPMPAIDQLDQAAIAQSADPAAAVKAAVGQKVRIDGSGSLAAINKALTTSFVSEGGSVNFEVNGTTQGLEALESGKVDLAAIGRPLTAAEKAKGLVAIAIKREKIAMIVGAYNPYEGNMTIDQFAKLFRGEVTDWSQIGGAAGPVRFVDQPEASDTRNALQNYPTFKAAPFQNGATTTRVGDEKAESLSSALGKDGISYVIADQARNLPGTKIVTMHKTQPDDPRYPFSHALYYVYKKGNLTPPAKAMLTHAAGPVGQAALAAVTVKDGLLPLQTEVTQAIGEAASPAAGDQTTTAIAPIPSAALDGGLPAWLWLPLLLGAGGLLWTLFKRPQGGSTPVGNDGAATPAAPGLPTTSIDPALGAAGTAAAIGTGLVGAGLAGGGDPEVAANAGPTIAKTEAVLTTEGTAGVLATEGDLDPSSGISPDSPSGLGINPGWLGAGAIAGGAAIGAAIGGNKGSEPTTPFASVTQLPAQDQPQGAIPEASAVESLETPAVFDEANAVAEAPPTTPVSGISAEPNAVASVEAAASPAPDAAPRASGLDLAAIAATTAGAATAGAIAQSFFVESPNVDDSPRSSESQDSEPATTTPVNPPAANPASTNTVIEHPVENTAENTTPGTSPNPAIGAAIATGTALGVAATLALGDVDGNLPDLPGGYGESRIVLMARDPQWAYAYWDVPEDHKEALRNQGGQQLALRLYDITDLNLSQSRPHSVQQYGLEEMTRDWYLPIPVSDRDYMAEVGYTTGTGTWLVLAGSNALRIPPVFPSDEIVDQFVTLPWEEPIQGKAIPLPGKAGIGPVPIHQQMFNMGMPGTAESRIAGSIGGDSSFIFPSGIGFESNLLGEAPFGAWTASGSGMGLTMSGAGLTMSGVGVGSFQPPTNKPRNFWLVADAELIVYGATEPDANLTIDGEPVQLNPDGTFRIQLSFQDGQLRFPIMAVAADGEQMRNITMNFNRTTPLRRTNTKAEAQDEWPDA
jgi:ABC-type phosphate transport system substrate-binding protein